jgi:hypothetical protein
LTADPLVVVTDTADPRAFARALARVVRTVPDGTGVAGVSARFPALPRALARRVRRVPVRSADDVDGAAATLLEHPGLVVVLSSRCKVAPQWWDAVVTSATALGGSVGLLGPGGSTLTLKPVGVSPNAATAPLLGIEGIDVRDSAQGAASAHGSRSEPVLISATMIVKDEEAVLEECLTALAPWVDEIVVYDTGSTDATVEIAERCGARVVRGYWDDDFAAARNRSLSECTHDWVFCVDADEVVRGDPRSVRAVLGSTDANVLGVLITSTTWRGGTAGHRMRADRVFRRSQLQWSGAVHERPVARPGSEFRISADLLDCELLHSGYQAEVMKAKGKVNRNGSLAAKVAASVEPGDADWAKAQCELGRSLLMAGHHEDAVEVLARVREHPEAHALLVAGRCAVPTLISLQRLDEADEWVAALAGLESMGALATWRARIALIRGDIAGARAALDFGPRNDAWGMPHDEAALDLVRTVIDILEGRADAGLATIHRQMATAPETVDINLVVLLSRRFEEASLADLVRRSPQVLLEKSLREAVSTLTPDVADEWLTAFTQVHPDDPRPVLAGCLLAVRLPLDGMVRWGAAARAAELADLCPLRAYAGDERNDPASRCLALAVCAETFGEAEAVAQWRSSLADVPDEDLAKLGEQLEVLAPALLAASV